MGQLRVPAPALKQSHVVFDPSEGTSELDQCFTHRLFLLAEPNTFKS